MLTPEAIMKDVENHYHLPEGSLKEYNALKTVAKARRLATYLSRTWTESSWAEIGDAFHRNEASIRQASKNTSDIEKEIEVFKKKYGKKWWRV